MKQVGVNHLFKTWGLDQDKDNGWWGRECTKYKGGGEILILRAKS